jgi:hypothetical protein
MRPIKLTVKTSAPNWRLDRALLGDDDADEEAHQPDDAERLDPHHLELADDGVAPEAAGMRDQIPHADHQRAEEAEQADHGAKRSGGRVTDFAEHAQEGRAGVGADLYRLIGGRDMLDQPLGILVAAFDDGIMIARGAVDDPGADRIEPLDAGDVDDRRRRIDRIEARGEIAELRERQRARHTHDAALWLILYGEIGRSGHARGQ